jgi:hypothetical protein
MLNNKLAQTIQTPYQKLDFELINLADIATLEIQISGLVQVDSFIEIVKMIDAELKLLNYNKLIYHNVGADPSSVTTDDLKRIVLATNAIHQTLRDGRFAAVADNKLSFGMFRMWHAFSSQDMQYDFEIFNNYESACRWVTRDN